MGFVTPGGINSPAGILALGYTNLIILTLGFFVVGCLTIENRWKHLWSVALWLWVVSLPNIAFLHVTFEHWEWMAPLLVVLLGIGGGAAALVRPNRARKSAQATENSQHGQPTAQASKSAGVESLPVIGKNVTDKPTERFSYDDFLSEHVSLSSYTPKERTAVYESWRRQKLQEATKQSVHNATSSPLAHTLTSDVCDALLRLNDLKEKGILTEQEFKAEKRKVLG